MKKRKKLLQRLFMPVFASALVLTGMPFQGVQTLNAAERDYPVEEQAEGEDQPDRVSEAVGTTEETDWIEKAVEPVTADGKVEGEDGTDEADDNDGEGDEGGEETEQADKTVLVKEIANAEKKNKADYSAAGWKKFAEALEAAKEINDKEDATQEEVDKAAENLQAAGNALVKVPGKPGAVNAVWEGAKKVTITWKKAANATKYTVYRSYKSSTAGFKKIADVKKTSYTDKSASEGKTAYYKVIAYNGAVKGDFSKVKSVYVVKTPASVKATASKNTITVSFQASAKASGYEIWSKTSKNGAYKRAAVLKSGKTVKKKFKNMKGGTYYYKVKAYRMNGKKKVYTAFGKEAKVKVSLGSTIENTKSELAIEADVKLTGKGSGCHAKLVMATPSSAVSFGLQYDQWAEAPYTGKTMALIENISSNNTGGQRYTRPGNIALQLNKTYHLMMTVDKKGNGDVYLDYKKIGSFSQPNLASEKCYLRIEACARLNGDSVNATFSNIKCKWNGKFDPSKVLGKSLQWNEFKQNAGLNYKYNKGKSIQIYGTVQGINGDWDSDYNSVSDILQFQGDY